jgi:hypothetical protein
MNACGNNTVSRSGNTGISGGTRKDVSGPLGSNGSVGLLTGSALRAELKQEPLISLSEPEAGL